MGNSKEDVKQQSPMELSKSLRVLKNVKDRITVFTSLFLTHGIHNTVFLTETKGMHTYVDQPIHPPSQLPI